MAFKKFHFQLSMIALSGNRGDVNRDICIFTGHTLNNPRYSVWSPGIRKVAKEELIKKADGMYET